MFLLFYNLKKLQFANNTNENGWSLENNNTECQLEISMHFEKNRVRIRGNKTELNLLSRKRLKSILSLPTTRRRKVKRQRERRNQILQLNESLIPS